MLDGRDERRAQWLRGVLDVCVLAVLDDREHYGYELSQRLAAAGLGRIKGGTLYPLLARLEEAGLVDSHWQPGTQGPGRKYYRLTAAGRAQLATQAGAWADFATSVGTLLRPPRRST